MMAIVANAQTQIIEKAGVYYLLKVYVKPKPGNIQYTVFDSSLQQIQLKFSLPANEDSVSLYLPKGRFLIQIIVDGKLISMPYLKQAKPDTLFITNKTTPNEKHTNQFHAIRL